MISTRDDYTLRLLIERLQREEASESTIERAIQEALRPEAPRDRPRRAVRLLRPSRRPPDATGATGLARVADDEGAARPLPRSRGTSGRSPGGQGSPGGDPRPPPGCGVWGTERGCSPSQCPAGRSQPSRTGGAQSVPTVRESSTQGPSSGWGNLQWISFSWIP